MRYLVLAASLLVGSAASAQGSALADVSSGWEIAGATSLRPTPTMERLHQARVEQGWAFLNANAKSREDILAYAAKCRKTVSRPGYCEIPEMRSIAYSGR